MRERERASELFWVNVLLKYTNKRTNYNEVTHTHELLSFSGAPEEPQQAAKRNKRSKGCFYPSQSALSSNCRVMFT